MKKKIIILLLVLMWCLFSGCNKDNEINEAESDRIKKYDSPYTLCNKNEDGSYSFYIYSSAIQYKTEKGYEMIDNTLVKSKNKNYAFENKANTIKTYFPETMEQEFLVQEGERYIKFRLNEKMDFQKAERVTMKNMYGSDVDGVMYKGSKLDLLFYATKAGIQMEIIIRSYPDYAGLNFAIECDAEQLSDKKNGYLLFYNENENREVIYEGLVKRAGDSKLEYERILEVNNKNKEDTITINFPHMEDDDYPVCLNPSFELYLSKMPDTTVYLKNKENCYLRNYAILGGQSKLGKSMQYVRFRINYFLYIDSDKVKQAEYCLRSLDSLENLQEIKMYKSSEQWSSTQMNWESKKTKGDLITVATLQDNVYKFDVTDFVKQCLEDTYWQTESTGIILESQKENQITVATSDNSLYAPYIHLVLTEEPTKFSFHEDINDIPQVQ